MLILTRHIKERIIIGNEIILKVIKIDEDKVRLGIIAPKNISLLRGENKSQTEKKK